jgi:hypothetical protein
MGSCNIKSVYDFKSNTIPDVHYLDRAEARVINIKTSTLDSTYFPDLSEIYKNSAILYLSDSEFMVAGGVKASGNFSKKVFRFNTSLKTFYRLQNLPAKSSLGSLIIHKSSIFLVGSVIVHCERLFPSPLMKFNISGECWEMIDVNDLTLPLKHSFSNILNPKAVLINSKLVLLGGRKLLKDDFTKKVFSIDLSESIPRLQLEDYSLPFKFLKLDCCYISNSILICGEVKTKKQECLVTNFSFENFEWSTLETIEGKMTEEYPVLVIGKKAVFFSYPFFLVQDRHKVTVVNFRSKPMRAPCSLDSLEASSEPKQNKHQPSQDSKRHPHKKKLKTQISAQYSKGTAPMLPSNILKQRSLSSSSSFSSSSASETSEVSSPSSS